jgi:hypothetical protein
MQFRHRLRLLVSIAFIAACTDAPSTGPTGARRARALTPALAIQAGTPTRPFYFLPPMVADPGPFAGVFDGGRVPTARVVCTGASDGQCPVVASFTAAGSAPSIKVDAEGQSYSAVWSASGSLSLGQNMYALEVYDGAVLLGRADLWVVAKQQDLKEVTAGYVGVVRGNPLVIKFRIEMERLVGAPDAPA